jgi:oxygen-independent coproporphyrinogen-3 oxidase
VLREASILGRQAFVRDRTLDFIYFGGGTPSYLSGKQLVLLMDGLRSALPWDEPSEVAFECEPGTLSERKLRAIRGFGVNRLSLGVENFDDGILAANNRAHRSKEIYRAWEWLGRTGFEQVNVDLIAGMIGETDPKWARTVSETVRLAPDAVTVYQMEIPFNTTIYRGMREQGVNAAPVADWPTKRRWTREAFEALEANGYHVGSAYTAVRDSSRIRFVYRDQLWDGADMLALGVSAFGYLDGVHYQNQPHMQPYLEGLASEALPVSRALSISAQEAMIRQFVLKMKLGRLETRPFLERFGVEVTERWRDVLVLFRDHGLLAFDEDRIDLTREGLLQVDRLLHAFFLPEHTNIRYA